MSTNLSRFKEDLKRLIDTGGRLEIAMQHECRPEESTEMIQKTFGKDAKKFIENLPRFKSGYQTWYSEAIALIRQILPDRLSDFIRCYEKPKTRKDITYENYKIEDYTQGIRVTRGGETVVPPSAALPLFSQQLAIVQAAESRFTSSLFEIRQIVQAEMLDSELEAAEELSKFKFTRAAGAVAGVVLERHLAQVCIDHSLSMTKKNPTISDFNEALKAASAIGVPEWRFVQHLADIRNLCDHSRTPEPTSEQVSDLISGVKKVIKTIY